MTEETIRTKVIPAITGRPIPNETERKLFSLPIKSGGLNIKLPNDHLNDLEWSCLMSSALEEHNPLTAELAQNRTKADIKQLKERNLRDTMNDLKQNLPEEQKYAVSLANQKGSSSWLNALPLERYNFNLNKSEFRDGLCLRYSWEPKNLPSQCLCGQTFNLTHSLQCAKGGYTIVRHNEIRDTFAHLLLCKVMLMVMYCFSLL